MHPYTFRGARYKTYWDLFFANLDVPLADLPPAADLPTRGYRGGVPLGYLTDRSGPIPVALPDPERAPLITELFERLACPWDHPRAVWETMNRRGLRTRRGLPLTFPSFEQVVTSPFYLGFAFFNGEMFRAPHEALVGEQTWKAAHKHLFPFT
jgi:hypothetical protein